MSDIIIRPVMSESTIEKAEKLNVLTFIVNPKANKQQVKKALKELYGVETEKVNVLVTPKGEKKAYIKLSPPYKASELITRLGLL